MPQSLSDHHKKLLFFSIFASIAMHLAEIHFIQRQSSWFSSSPQVEISHNDWTDSLEKMDRDQILKDAFLNGSEAIQTEKKSFESAASLLPEASLFGDYTLPQHQIEPPPNQSIRPTFSDIFALKFEPPFIPFEEQISLLPHLPRELILPATTPKSPMHSVPDPLTIAIQIPENLPNIPVTPPMKFNKGSSSVAFEPSWVNQKFLSSSIPTPSFPLAQNIPSLHELKASSYSKSFDTEVVFYEIDDGYLFAVTLIPRPEFQLNPLKQNYLFLIDRSNSIQKERLNATKSAVRKAIDELNKNDQFNIVVFDQKLEKLSPSMLSVCPESLNKAHQFLNKIELGSFFSQKNLNKPLFLTIPHHPKNDELYTAILITDGENLSHKSAVQGLVDEWTRMNQGNVTLYTLGMNDDSHLDILDSISNMNRGKNFSSPTYRGLKRKLLKIMKTVHSPIAKNLTCKAIPRYRDNTIELFPKPTHAPHLYAGEPYVILGTTKKLDDFVLFVQARLDKEWLHIKKNISFDNAKKGNAALATELAQLKSFDLYQQYLEGKGHQCLNQAQSLLKQHELPSLFEL